MNFRMGRRRYSLWKNLDMLIVRTGLLCLRLESRGSQVQRGPLSSVNDKPMLITSSARGMS